MEMVIQNTAQRPGFQSPDLLTRTRVLSLAARALRQVPVVCISALLGSSQLSSGVLFGSRFLPFRPKAKAEAVASTLRCRLWFAQAPVCLPQALGPSPLPQAMWSFPGPG